MSTDGFTDKFIKYHMKVLNRPKQRINNGWTSILDKITNVITLSKIVP